MQQKYKYISKNQCLVIIYYHWTQQFHKFSIYLAEYRKYLEARLNFDPSIFCLLRKSPLRKAQSRQGGVSGGSRRRNSLYYYYQRCTRCTSQFHEKTHVYPGVKVKIVNISGFHVKTP